MSEIEVRQNNLPVYQEDPTGGRLVAWAQAAAAANQLAQSLSRTSFVPASFKGNAGDATAAIIMGDELGLSPLAALRSIFVIHGQPAMYARTMVALAQSRGHAVWTEKSTDAEVVVCGQRRGSEHVERSVWSMARAQKAGYTNNKKYATNPQEMLYSKAAAEIARKIAADVLAGVPFSVEDLELEAEPTPEPVAKVTRVSRAKPAPVEIPEPDLTPEDAQPDEPVDAEIVDGPPLSDGQLKNIHRLLGKLNVGKDREAGLALISDALGGIEVESSKDLTSAQARSVITFLMDLAGESDEA